MHVGGVLVLAAGVWSLWPHASFAAALLAYAVAWLAVELLARFGPATLDLSRAQAGLVAAALLGAAVSQYVRLDDSVLAYEALDAVDHQTRARLRLERSPAIFPGLVSDDRPQLFYVNAPGAQTVAARFGSSQWLEARALGAGVFRVHYDPRRDGPPGSATLRVDGAEHARAVRTVSFEDHPRWLRSNPSRRRVAAVSEETDALFVLGERELLYRAEVGDGPTDVAFVDETRLLVAHRYEDAWLVDGDGARLRSLPTGPFVQRLAVLRDADGLRAVAVARGGSRPEIQLYDGSLDPMGTVPLGTVPDWVCFARDASRIVVATRADSALHTFARDASGDYVEDRRPILLGRPAVTLARGPDGSTLHLAATDFDPRGETHLGNHFVQDQRLELDVDGWRIARTTPTERRTDRQQRPGSIDRGVSPMAFDIGDTQMVIAFAGSDEIAFEADGAMRFVPLDGRALATPHGVAALHDGNVWVSSPVYGAFGLFSPDGTQLASVTVAPTDRELLEDDQPTLQYRIGERMFYETTRAGISCQSCHLHGSSDGARHNIGGNALVGTLDVRGLLGTPPFLRDGGYPRLGHLDEVAHGLYRGYLRTQGGRRVSLDRYLGSLPRATPFSALEPRDEARERRGLAAFVRARCATCHTPPAFTNLGAHPAEALFPNFAAHHASHEFDTPSLLNLPTSAPYLVDGRAQTLTEVFRTYDPAGRHGDTSQLDDTELADLIYFLEGL